MLNDWPLNVDTGLASAFAIAFALVVAAAHVFFFYRTCVYICAHSLVLCVNVNTYHDCVMFSAFGV